jgi:hypothetical protein
MLLGSIFKKATQDPVTYRRVDTSSAAGVAEASRKPNIITDVKMGLGLIPEDSSYRARTERTKLRNKMSANKTDYGNYDSPVRAAPKPRQPTAAELKAQRKAAKLAERKRLGQIARKKFEKEGGERTAKKRALLLNIT